MNAVPRTSKEARIFFQRAVLNNNFDAAEDAYNQMLDLQIIEDEMKLGKMVDTYMNQKELLSVQCEKNVDQYDKPIKEKIQEVQNDFMLEFEEIKKKQAKELDDVFEKWKNKKEEIEAKSVGSYQSALQTARLLAFQTKFQEAKFIQKSAFNTTSQNINNQLKSINKRYKEILNAITERHEVELSSLVVKRNNKISSLYEEMNEASDHAHDCFTVFNANEVVETAKTANRKMPLALIYQTRNNDLMESQKPSSVTISSTAISKASNSKSGKLTPRNKQNQTPNSTKRATIQNNRTTTPRSRFNKTPDSAKRVQMSRTEFRGKMKTYNHVFTASDFMNDNKKTPTQKKKKANTSLTSKKTDASLTSKDEASIANTTNSTLTNPIDASFASKDEASLPNTTDAPLNNPIDASLASTIDAS